MSRGRGSGRPVSNKIQTGACSYRCLTLLAGHATPVPNNNLHLLSSDLAAGGRETYLSACWTSRRLPSLEPRPTGGYLECGLESDTIYRNHCLHYAAVQEINFLPICIVLAWSTTYHLKQRRLEWKVMPEIAALGLHTGMNCITGTMQLYTEKRGEHENSKARLDNIRDAGRKRS